MLMYGAVLGSSNLNEYWNWVNVSYPGILILVHCVLARTFGKRSIEVNYSLFNSLWSQWCGYRIEPKIDYTIYHQANEDSLPIDIQHTRMIKWTHKHISGRWVKRFNNYVFLKKRDAIAFKLVWG